VSEKKYFTRRFIDVLPLAMPAVGEALSSYCDQAPPPENAHLTCSAGMRVYEIVYKNTREMSNIKLRWVQWRRSPIAARPWRGGGDREAAAGGSRGANLTLGTPPIGRIDSWYRPEARVPELDPVRAECARKCRRR
jgi:hypothetical protein